MGWCGLLGVLGLLACAVGTVWLAVWVYRAVEAAMFVRREFRCSWGSWVSPSRDHRHAMADIYLLQARALELQKRIEALEKKKRR